MRYGLGGLGVLDVLGGLGILNAWGMRGIWRRQCFRGRGTPADEGPSTREGEKVQYVASLERHRHILCRNAASEIAASCNLRGHAPRL
jgi:hypothetical protein